MYNTEGLIPTRFLILIAHLTLLLSLLWGSRMNEWGCSGAEPPQPALKHNEIVIGLSLSLGMIGVELLLFLCGITMFHSTSSLLSICAHSTAGVILVYFILDSWQCGWFWWIFACGSVLPFLSDLCILLNVFLRGKWA